MSSFTSLSAREVSSWTNSDIIGGKRTVQAATEGFYRRVFADKTLSPFFKNTDVEQLHARQAMFITMLLGGRNRYTGRDISLAHAHAREQGLHDGHFDRFLRHFLDALKEVGVEADRGENCEASGEQARRGSSILENCGLLCMSSWTRFRQTRQMESGTPVSNNPV